MIANKIIVTATFMTAESSKELSSVVTSDSIVALTSVANIILIIMFSIFNIIFQHKTNKANQKFQSDLYNLNFNSYWMHEIIFQEFKKSLDGFENECIDLINTKGNEIYSEFTPVSKSFMLDLTFFDIFTKSLKIQIRDLVVDLEDIVTDVRIHEKKRCMELRKTKINIINLIYKYDCDLHKIP